MIRRRHVLYVEGYDPQGAEGYYRLFRREWKRFLSLRPIEAKLGELSLESDDIAHWTIDAAGPTWRATTRYEFLRQERLIRANMAQPMLRQLGRAIRWMLDDLASGALWRIARASWRFALVLVYFQTLLLTWVAVAVAGGWLAAAAIMRFAGWPALVAIPIGIAVGAALVAALRPLADRWFVVQITNHWPYLRELARGRPTGFDRPIEIFARRLVAAARAGAADEILVIGHSGGGVLAPAIVAHALELDPDLGRHGPRVALLTLGSIMPAVALHPSAATVRAAIRRVAIEPSVLWVDCQSRKDVMNFWDFDPVAGVGIAVSPEPRNPLVWSVRMRDLVSPEFYARLRWNFFRMHYQFIMANDRRALYDYFMLVCGPVPLSCWCAPQCAWAKARGRAHGGWRPPAIEAKPPPAPARRSQRETLDASV